MELTALELTFWHNNTVEIVVLPRRYRLHPVPIYHLSGLLVRQWNSCHFCINGKDFLLSCCFHKERRTVKCFLSFTNRKLNTLMRVKMNLLTLSFWSALRCFTLASFARHVHNTSFSSILGLWLWWIACGSDENTGKLDRISFFTGYY